ncbi:unnamed protein product [Rotaria socialis]|uniref:Uncharacterized protein n=1 Tax=Rotaria socialis TaxID=392032 RepID=A0A818XUJ6_9BILA|nr:unnamed protein product [Rotaria socialis]CAF3251920.1 unnamed protein product [Rotaria socialis]CAF3744109.1 unnamed protein product [Rotaria socialis]CAF3749332.1 unnamed protein product [Rotaria socialis]CAF3771668.1 unnamed protein product [Rotaria socialis]
MPFLAKIDSQINDTLLVIKQMRKTSQKKMNRSSINRSLLIITANTNKNINAILPLSISKNNNQENTLSKNFLVLDKQNDSMISEDFPHSHIYNRDIRDIPLSKRNDTDLDRLRSCNILTMTDLIGRYLIHKTSDEFRQFLIEKLQCSQSFTDDIIQLLQTWTLYNLHIRRGTRVTTLKQYL